jgi:predicted transposase YdaD
VRVGDEVYIHHFEALTYYRSDWGEAQMEHAVYIRMKYRVPVYSHLLLLHERGAPATIQNVIVQESGSLQQRLDLNVVRLWQRPAAEVLATQRVVLYPWTALMDATVEQQQEAARRIDESGREGLRMQMTLLGSLRFGSKEAFFRRVGRMLLTKEILRESPFWQEIEREGEARGKAEGKAEGLAEGERRILRRFLIDRFGPLPEWAEQQIDAADLNTIERWAGQVASATSIATAIE